MSTPKIIRTDTLGKPTLDSPLKGQISRFYNDEAIACDDRTKDLAQLESVGDIE